MKNTKINIYDLYRNINEVKKKEIILIMKYYN